MISISGIKYQKELEMLPCFNKIQAGILIDKKGRNLDQKILQLIKKGYLMSLKKGLYTTSVYADKNNKEFFSEFIANNLRSPSYISGEYVLAKSGLIPEAVYSITSITTKSSRTYMNFLGNFIYQNIQPVLFTGYQTINWENKQIYSASPAKALFDFLYLKKLRNLKTELTSDLRINWNNFSRESTAEFGKYAEISQSTKMLNIYNIIKKYAD